MSELKVIDLGNIRESIEKDEPVYYEYYAKSEADKVIAEKDAVIAELIEKNERLASKDKIMASETIKDVLKELRHSKYKQCLAMAELCQWKMGVFIYHKEKNEFYYRWQKRWLELAEKFKEDK